MYMVVIEKQLTNEELMKIFGGNVQKYRIQRNLTQQRLPEILNCSIVFLSMLENGHYGVQFKNIAQLANALHIEPYQLFEIDESLKRL